MKRATRVFQAPLGAWKQRPRSEAVVDYIGPPLVKTVFFDLFLFATGYKVGPQFFRGLKKDACRR